MNKRIKKKKAKQLERKKEMDLIISILNILQESEKNPREIPKLRELLRGLNQSPIPAEDLTDIPRVKFKLDWDKWN